MFVQEHNLHPDRLAELERSAVGMGLTLVVGFAPAAPDGVHRGGVMCLSFDKECKVERVVERSADLVRVVIEAGGRKHDVAGVYAPAKPGERVDMFRGLAARLSEATIVGGDWNCVPDVTLDVKSDNALNYPNVGAALLASEMDSVNLYDIRLETRSTAPSQFS